MALKARIGIGSCAALVALGSPALAGDVRRQEVSILSSFASGSVSAARFSADTLQQIGCFTEAGSNWVYGACYARTSSGQYLWCSSRDPRLLAVMATVTASSLVSFAVASNRYDCSSLRVDNGSPHVQ